MGECGCGEMIPHKVFKIGNRILAVEIYRGCQDCCTGITVTLNLFTKKEWKTWDIEPDAEFKVDEHGYAQIAFPIIEQEDLVAVAKSEEYQNIFDGENGYENLEDFFHDEGLRILQEAVEHCQLRQKGYTP
ncbi:MAG: hypothetical protein ABSG90_12875 [Dehalococcoidia bacterium]|jgi:hypothetical protein